ncbi:Aste57867_25441 [Aphanomyces stellatus]|uniref:Aste57867_25441 protein n=1 Tax=Aphanomyces stellatus TaxID=120398 RepID=A0A485LXX4_9STRA|nr:hypothetical protein As57867_025362 [Aphanomyces stellatus]VFU02064.1 Aste57867_25441 [Aphanomyces stellatus]
MAAVAPHVVDLSSVQPRSTRCDWFHRLGGLTYVTISFAMTVKYMTIMHAYAENDYLWTDFNASGAQTFVSDVFNSQLWNTTSGTRDLSLFSTNVALEKDYSQAETRMTVQATDARRIIMEQLNNLPLVIAGLRSQTPRQSGQAMTCYCWLDFEHQWEVAHTTARQARCAARYANNGAVYMEAMLRNTDWAAWSTMWGLKFQVAYGNALYESPGGKAWLNQTSAALPTVDVATEIQYWQQHNVTEYLIPWNNLVIGGFDNSVTVQTAFRTFSLALNHVQMSLSGVWTSGIASYGIWNDLEYAVEVNASLVRNASNPFTQLDDSLNPEMWTGGYPDTPWSIVFHNTIGSFASVDLIYVLPPPSLVAMYDALYVALLRALQSNDHLNELYHSVSTTTTFDMVPPAWIGPNVMYFGGNLFCYSGNPHTYVQQSFGFDDACTEPFSPMTVTSQTKNIVLSLFLNYGTTNATAMLKTICALAHNKFSTCLPPLQGAAALLGTWLSIDAFPSDILVAISTTTRDIVALQISLMQYANWNDTPSVLYQPILDEGDCDWSFYGWLHLLDWLQGTREVIAFDGDVTTLVLISQQNAPHSFAADPLEIPTRLSYVVRLLLWYMCVASASVIALALVHAVLAHGDFYGPNLYFMNPVVGIIWIGRPFLMLRGLTTIAVLSSANVHLQSDRHFTHLVATSRTALDIIVVSCETLWLTYVINDVVSVVTSEYSFLGAFVSCTTVWIATLAVELSSPFVPVATFDRSCVSSNMEFQLNCSSGTIEVGSFRRFTLLCVVQCICVCVSHGVVRVIAKSLSVATNPPAMIPAIAMTYFVRTGDHRQFYFDACSSVLSGMIPFRFFQTKYVFSVVLWVFVAVEETKSTVRVQPTSMQVPAVTARLNHQLGWLDVVSISQWPIKARAMASVIFLAGSAISSALFFFIIQDQLSNDFLWAGFNATGMQPFIVDWYNTKLFVQPLNSPYDMDGTSNMALYNASTATVTSSGLCADLIQFEQLSLLKVVQGLRMSDACQLPWIATQYCWVDFDRQWEMANSYKRQRRCQDMSINGAVYVEPVLRNANVNGLRSCWGDAIEIGILIELRKSTAGLKWMDSMTTILPLVDEVAYWSSKYVTQFVTQWQDYKSRGLVETVAVQTAFGLTYPLTLKSSDGAYQFSLQTSMKMYWGWGNDLRGITQNDTRLGHRSLIRSSATFAFSNATLEDAMMQNNMLQSPLDEGLALVRDTVGPFGAVDIVHVACPSSLFNLYQAFASSYTSVLQANTSAQAPVPGAASMINPIPTTWLDRYSVLRGGDILCPTFSAQMPLTGGMMYLFVPFLSCSIVLAENIGLSLTKSVLALAAWGHFKVCNSTSAECPNILAACTDATVGSSSCTIGFQGASDWASTYLEPTFLDNMLQMARQAQTDVSLLDINVVQYAQVDASSPIELLQIPVVDSGDASFDLMTWTMLIDWATGLREVISLQGDRGTLTLISSEIATNTNTPNPLEIPNHVSYYCQLCIQYTTAMVFLITVLALVYATACRGHIEGRNMFEINRVGGIVWVGRPLLFLRSSIAILILTTATVELEISGIFTKMTTPKTSGIHTLSTLLAGSETCWLVIVLTDLFVIATKDLTKKYSFKSSIVTAFASILLSWVSPVTPRFHVARTCDTTQMDLQLTCHSGIVQIGDSERTLQLVIMTSSVVCLCFVWEYWRQPKFKLPSHFVSLLLPAGAHYLYHKKPWIFNNTLYLDKASAFMCGLVSVKYNKVVYLIDIKTWRAHAIDIDFDSQLLSPHTHDQMRIEHALPMVD